MTVKRQHCVRDAISLLTEVREALNGKANAALIEKLDESIRQLAEIEGTDRIDTRLVIEALRTLGDFLVLVPAIADLMDRWTQ